jgi:formylmethanofuran dehydrogenase subunit E
MDFREIISKIDKEDICFIQEEVPVQYDNTQQTPLGFQWRDNHHEVLKPLHFFKSAQGHLQHLILTNRGVFCLSLERENQTQAVSRSRWILKYRVDGEDSKRTDSIDDNAEDDSARNKAALPRGTSKMAMVPLKLANVVYYHGHLCPELAVGYRAALVAQREVGLSRENALEFFILAENMSSAIEALQLLTGCTIGNQNFLAYDLGKHVYYFGRTNANREPQEVLRLALVSRAVDLGLTGELDNKIFAGQGTETELEQYRQAVDTAVQAILELPEEQLFVKKMVTLQPPRFSGRFRYTACSRCGEIVSLEKSISGKEGLYCRVCAAKVD